MSAAGKRRNCRVSVLLALLWLPNAVLQCPSCPGSETRLLRCPQLAAGKTAVAQPAESAAAHENCHKSAGATSDDTSDCRDCCASLESRAALGDRTAAEAPPPVVSIGYTLPEATLAAALPRDKPLREPLPPPRQLFVLFRSLLL